jgi:hypothetical protein
MAEVAVMTSIVQVDSRLQQRLPPKAQIKLRRLLAAAIDCESAFQSIIQRQERLREELGSIKSEKQQAYQRQMQISADADQAQAAGAKFNGAIDDLEAEILRLDQQRAWREKARTDSAQLIAQLREFLARLAPQVSLADYPRQQPQIRDGENFKTGVELVRAEITGLKQKQLAIARAPLPRDELIQKAKSYIDELRKAAKPMVNVERGGFQVTWGPGVQAQTAIDPPAVVTWARSDPDGLLADLMVELDQIKGHGLPEAERPRHQQQLDDELAELERAEEAMIVAAEEADQVISRRPAASPWAVLQISELVPAAVAAE